MSLQTFAIPSLARLDLSAWLADVVTATAATGMTAGGWVMMILSVGAVTLFFAWCLYKVLTTPQSTEHIHSPSDIDTQDQD